MRSVAAPCLAAALAACGPHVAAPSAAPRPPSVVDAPAGDAEAFCAAHPTAHPASSTFFASASVEDADSVDVPSNGDLWPSCSSGDVLYAASDRSGRRPDIGIVAIRGTPADPSGMQGTNVVLDDARKQALFRVWTRGPYYQKPTGMLCLGGRIYAAVQDLNYETYDDVPAATVAVSEDHGRTWKEGAAPMFTGAVFTTVMFLDAGPDGALATDGYVYAYGLDHNWRATTHVIEPQGLYLARIPSTADLLDRAAWDFYAGADGTGGPTWSRDIRAKRAVLVDCTRRHVHETKESPKGYTVISQGGVVYDAPLRRYLYASWTEYTFELYEAPAPWGPWKPFLSKDFGLPPWTARNNGGYGTTLPSRFVSPDGTRPRTRATMSRHGGSAQRQSLRSLRHRVAPGRGRDGARLPRP
jgi:hypothetical protein